MLVSYFHRATVSPDSLGSMVKMASPWLHSTQAMAARLALGFNGSGKKNYQKIFVFVEMKNIFSLFWSQRNSMPIMTALKHFLGTLIIIIHSFKSIWALFVSMCIAIYNFQKVKILSLVQIQNKQKSAVSFNSEVNEQTNKMQKLTKDNLKNIYAPCIMLKWMLIDTKQILIL